MPAYEPLEKRFWKYVNKKGPNECWEWIGLKTKGKFKYGRIGNEKGGMSRANRVSWILHFGTIPKKLNVLHHCDNPPCVNPAHLFLGTYQDNTNDAKNKGRLPFGEKHKKAKLKNIDIMEIKKLYKNKISVTNILKIFKVSRNHIYRILRGERWKHLKYCPVS